MLEISVFVEGVRALPLDVPGGGLEQLAPNCNINTQLYAVTKTPEYT